MPGEEDRLQHALGLAHRYLNPRERTVGEVRRRLEQGGVEPDVAEQALAILGEQGCLDDQRFARLFVQDKQELEQWGAERIRRGLLARGIDPELIAAALHHQGPGQASGAVDSLTGAPDGLTSAADEPPQTELDRALALLGRRFPSPPRDRRERDQALGVLIRKGYDPELAVDALSAYARAGTES